MRRSWRRVDNPPVAGPILRYGSPLCKSQAVSLGAVSRAGRVSGSPAGPHQRIELPVATQPKEVGVGVDEVLARQPLGEGPTQ